MSRADGRPGPSANGGTSDGAEVFDGATQLRLATVERLELRGEDRIAGLVSGAGYPDALDPIADALVGARGPVLDVGAGLGAASAYLAARSRSRVVTLEPEGGAAALAAMTFSDQSTIVGEAAALPVVDGGCGGVTFLGSLSLVPDLDRVLGDAVRTLRADGRVGITDLCLVADRPELPTGSNVFRSVADLVRALDRHGFGTDSVLTASATRGTRWDDITDLVDAAMERWFGSHHVMAAWREDREAVHELITAGTLHVATILATRRLR
jgi:SAM-dependent methyltransferase